MELLTYEEGHGVVLKCPAPELCVRHERVHVEEALSKELRANDGRFREDPSQEAPAGPEGPYEAGPCAGRRNGSERKPTQDQHAHRTPRRRPDARAHKGLRRLEHLSEFREFGGPGRRRDR
jgi:hypothetical protein